MRDMVILQDMIDWSTKQSYRDMNGSMRFKVSVQCPICYENRFVDSRYVYSKGSTGMCKKCNSYRYGSRCHFWRGGRHLTSSGYMTICVSPEHPFYSMANKRNEIYEHRLVMAKKLGRSLLPLEHVHHINGNKLDNRPENLELLNQWTHNLITKLDKRIKDLELENAQLKLQVDMQ